MTPFFPFKMRELRGSTERAVMRSTELDNIVTCHSSEVRRWMRSSGIRHLECNGHSDQTRSSSGGITKSCCSAGGRAAPPRLHSPQPTVAATAGSRVRRLFIRRLPGTAFMLVAIMVAFCILFMGPLGVLSADGVAQVRQQNRRLRSPFAALSLSRTAHCVTLDSVGWMRFSVIPVFNSRCMSLYPGAWRTHFCGGISCSPFTCYFY